MVAVSYHDRVNVLQALPLANAAPFDRPEWYELLADEGGLRPVIALASDGGDSAAVALMGHKGALEPMANWYNFFWRPLTTKGADALPLLTAIAGDLARHQRRITLSQVPGEDVSAELIARAFREAGWAVIAEECGTNHILRVEGRSFADYLAERPGPLRTTLKRKAGKVDVTVLTHFENAAWRDYEAVYTRSWKPAEGKPAMLRRFAEQEGEAGADLLAGAAGKGVHSFVHDAVQLEGIGKILVQEAGIVTDIFQHIEDLGNGHVIGEAADLRHVAYAGAVLPSVCDVPTVESDISAVGDDHAQQTFDECGLAAAVGSDEGNGTSRWAREVDVLKHL